MDKAQILEQVKHVLHDKFSLDVNEIDIDSKLVDLGIDSLDAVQLVIDCEHEFDISVSDFDIDSIDTISVLIDIIDGKVN